MIKMNLLNVSNKQSHISINVYKIKWLAILKEIIWYSIHSITYSFSRFWFLVSFEGSTTEHCEKWSVIRRICGYHSNVIHLFYPYILIKDN